MEPKEILKGRNKHRSTFAVMFYINRTKMKKDGMCQLLCRVTIDTSVAQIGTKIMVDPSVWDGNRQTVRRNYGSLQGTVYIPRLRYGRIGKKRPERCRQETDNPDETLSGA